MSVLIISYFPWNFPKFSADECKTNGGNRPNSKCVFPFLFKGTWYESCTIVDDNTPWCSTEVYPSGQHVAGEWGYCGKGCPGTTEGILLQQ